MGYAIGSPLPGGAAPAAGFVRRARARTAGEHGRERQQARRAGQRAREADYRRCFAGSCPFPLSWQRPSLHWWPGGHLFADAAELDLAPGTWSTHPGATIARATAATRRLFMWAPDLRWVV